MSTPETTSAADVAAWLMGRVREVAPRRAFQSTLVREMVKAFGPEWSYKNHNGNPAIDRGVLKEFGKLKDEHVIWDSSDQSWRIVDDHQLAVLVERAERQRLAKEERARRKAEWEAARK